MSAAERVIVFTKVPAPGLVKTRLARVLGADTAARLYRAMVADTVRSVFTEAGIAGTLACTPAPDDFLRTLAGTWRLSLDVQRGADLTARLAEATARARAGGAARVLFIGADSPTLPRTFVDLAFARLRAGRDVVLGPSFDGGYTLVALGPAAEPGAIFAGVPWDTDGALAATRVNVERAGLRLAYTPTWYDVDEIADLQMLRGHLDTLGPAAAGGAPETRRMLATIPALDDAPAKN